MKVLFVNGSSHIHGTTMKALEEMIKIFEEEKIETEVIQLGGKPLADCTQCNSCQKTGQCVFKEDGVNEFVAKAREADGFVFATPVYFAHPSGRIFSFLDRAFYNNGKDEVYEAFQFKPSAAVAVARRGGTTAALDALNKYFGIAQMPVAGSTYWNMVHGLYADFAGRRRNADHAKSCKKYGVDDEMFFGRKTKRCSISSDRNKCLHQFYQAE